MTLYPHQVTGIAWLSARSRAYLADEQGLGKTITALAAVQALGCYPVLVCAPTVVTWNWAAEAATWLPGHRVQVLSTGRDVLDPAAHVVIVSHALLLSEQIREQLLSVRWGCSILDEAHFFRTRSAKRTRLWFGVYGRPAARTIISRSDRCWLLSGTPAPNDVSELWAPLFGLWPERLAHGDNHTMTFSQFRERFCDLQTTRYGDGVRILGNKRSTLPELKRRLEGLFLRRLKTDHLDLPAIRWETVAVRPETLPAELEALAAELPEWNGDLSVLAASEPFARYRRLCGLAKLAPAAELLSLELDGELQKVVVFCHHRDVAAGLVSALAKYGVVSITGDTPALERQAAVRSFQTNPEVRVAVCQIVAGGTGVTLTAASDVVFVESSFVPGEVAQAADRVHRIGQDQQVRVRFLSLAGTVDELIVKALRRKTAMLREVAL